MANERQMAVADAFYPRDAKRLKRMVEEFISQAKIDNKISKEAISYVAPHAGYIYSGKTAGFTYKAVAENTKVETFVVIGPNHTGYGTPISISDKDWLTPFGIVHNDLELTKAISEYSEEIVIEEGAHRFEHSIEVQLPFLQSVAKNPKCVFICMGDQSHDASELLFKAILEAEEKSRRKITVIASSDFNHYESADVARQKDMPAIGALLDLNTKKFVKSLEESNDTACGYGPITVSALYARVKNAKRGYLLNYSNSGDANEDYGSVVAYASILFS